MFFCDGGFVMNFAPHVIIHCVSLSRMRLYTKAHARVCGQESMAAPGEATPAQEDSAALDNPFIVLDTEQPASGGGSEGPSPPAALQTTESSRPPPAYTEALRRPS